MAESHFGNKRIMGEADKNALTNKKDVLKSHIDGTTLIILTKQL